MDFYFNSFDRTSIKTCKNIFISFKTINAIYTNLCKIKKDGALDIFKKNQQHTLILHVHVSLDQPLGQQCFKVHQFW